MRANVFNRVTGTASRFPWELFLFLPLGWSLMFLAGSFSVVKMGEFVLVSTLAVALPPAAGQALRQFSKLRKCLTWWHGLWLLVLLSGLVFRIRGTEEIREETLDLWAGYRIAMIGLVVAVLAVRLAFRRTPWLSSLFRGSLGAMAIYCIVCLASTIWSVYPAWTLYKSAEYFAELAVVAAILASIRSAEEYRSLFDWTWLLYGLLLASIWISSMVVPNAAWEHSDGMMGVQLSGAFPLVSANLVGEIGAMLALVSTGRLVCKSSARSLWTLALVVGVATMIVAQTRSAIGGFLCGLFVILMASARVKSALLALGIGLVLSIGKLGDFVWAYILRGQTLENFEHASSRVDWWQAGWQKFLEQPWGYGAYAGGRFVVLDPLGEVSNMHSTYFEILVGSGIVGLIPVVVALSSTWWMLMQAWRHPLHFPQLDRRLVVEAAGVLALLTVRSIFSVKLVWHPAIEFLVILGYAEMLRRSAHSVWVARPVDQSESPAIGRSLKCSS